MQTFNLYDFIADAEQRKRSLGIDESPSAVDALRNKGGSRSPAKRALLCRAEERARAAGVTPVRGYY